MVKSEQQKQRKLAKKKSKERENRKLVAQKQQQMSSLSGQMTAAAKAEIEGCYIASACHNGTGIGSVVIVRRLASGQRAFAMFLVDVFCLGAKDALGKMCTASQVNDILDDLRQRDPIEAVEPGVARGFVEAAIEYASSIGIAPHPDYRKVAPIWGDIEAAPVPDKYQFGQDGKPHFVPGPYDDNVRQLLVVKTLVKNVGEGNFNYTMIGQSYGGQPMSTFGFDTDTDTDTDTDDEDEDDWDESSGAGDANTIDGSVIQRIDSVTGQGD